MGVVIVAIVPMTTTSVAAAALLPAVFCVAMRALMGMHGRNGGH